MLQRRNLRGGLLLVALFLSGCSGGASAANFEKIKEGMKRTEVETILGKGVELHGPDDTFGDVFIPTPEEKVKEKATNMDFLKWTTGTEAFLVVLIDGEVSHVYRRQQKK